MTHGEAQLRSRWLHNGAQVVLDTCGVKVFLPGISDTATLSTAEAISVVTNGAALATHFGDGVLRAADVAAGLTVAVVKDPAGAPAVNLSKVRRQCQF